MRFRAFKAPVNVVLMLALGTIIASCSDDRHLLDATPTLVPNQFFTPASTIVTPAPQALSRTDRVVTETCDEGVEQPCLAIDADPDEDGTQRERTVAAGEEFAVDVIAHGVPEGGRGAGTFQLTLTYTRAQMEAGVPRPASGAVTAGAECSVPPPTADLGDDHGFADGNPDTGDALVACIVLVTPTTPPGPTGSVQLATFTFTAAAAGEADLALVLSQVNTVDRIAPPLVDCSPGAPSPGGGCQDARIIVE
jgi:hypothetical protein